MLMDMVVEKDTSRKKDKEFGREQIQRNKVSKINWMQFNATMEEHSEQAATKIQWINRDVS